MPVIFHCSHRGCGNRMPCAVHQRSTARYGRRWQRFRLAFLRGEHIDLQWHREIPACLCVPCYLRGLIVAATDVDHVIPLPADVRTDRDPRMYKGPFQGMDARCHREKTREDQRAR